MAFSWIWESPRKQASKTQRLLFSYDAPLDMRFNPDKGPSAADLLNSLSEKDLADLIWRYTANAFGRIARKIVENRPLKTTFQLAELVRSASGASKGRSTQPRGLFQATGSRQR